MSTTTETTMKVLHLVGSQTSEYYYGVSKMYAPGFFETFTELNNIILLARLDGTWSIPSSLEEKDIEAAPRISLPDALKLLQDVHKPDVFQPHMFCYKGMTTFRYLADLLDIPLIGCNGAVMALTTDKWQTRAIVSSMGVPCPKAQLLRPGDQPTMSPPFILKPCREDNSMGISLVQAESQTKDALSTAFGFDDMILCEEFIPLGRELRVGVVDSADGKSLEMLPIMEYFLHNKSQPIRTSADKIQNGSDDKDNHKTLLFAATDRQTPADIDDTLKQKLYDLATKSHVALNCQHYSLCDVRVCPKGEPYFIECSTYCSFSPNSAVICMGRGGGLYDNKELFYRIANRAIAQHKAAKASHDTHKLGMRTQAEKISS